MQAGLGETLMLVVARRLAGCSSHRWDVLYRYTLRSYVVYLTRRGYIDQIVGLNLNLITGWQESVKTHNKVRVALKELRHTVDDSRCVYAVETEAMILHYDFMIHLIYSTNIL